MRQRSGSALVITLGLLAVLGLLVVGYVFTARTERFAVRHRHDRVVSRQFINLALDDALRNADLLTYLNGSPSLFNRYYYNFDDGSVYYAAAEAIRDAEHQPHSPNILVSYSSSAGAATNVSLLNDAVGAFLPNSLIDEYQQWQLKPRWSPIQAVIEGSSSVSGTNGYISFAIFNCSGLLDANHATSNQLEWLSSRNLDIEVLPDFLTARAQATTPDLPLDQFISLPDLRQRGAGLSSTISNLFVWSYDPGPDVTVTNGLVYSNREVKLVPKFDVNSWTNGLAFSWDGESDRSGLSDLSDELQKHYKKHDFTERWLPEVTNRFAAAGLPNPEALAWNLINFMDPDRVPQGPEGHIAWQEPWPVEDVPLINEVAVGMVPLDLNDNKPNHYAPGIELWFPFATNRITAADEAQLVVAVYTNWPPVRWDTGDKNKIEEPNNWTNNVIYPEETFDNRSYGFTFSNAIPEMAQGTITEFLTFVMPEPYISFPVVQTNAIPAEGDDFTARDDIFKPQSGSNPTRLVAYNNPDGTRLDPAPAYELIGTNLFLPLGIASYYTYIQDGEVWVREMVTTTNTIHLLPRVKLGDYWVDEAAGYHPGIGNTPARTNLLVFNEPCGYEVDDPRRNGRFEDWRRYPGAPGSAVIGLEACTLNGTTNTICNPWHLPYGQGLPLRHFNRLLRRAGEIGYLQQPEERIGESATATPVSWQSIALADDRPLRSADGFGFGACSILEFFTVRATNAPVRGRVHFSTTHTNVVQALAADLTMLNASNRLLRLDDVGVEWFTKAFFEAQAALYGGGSFPIGVGDLGFGFGASDAFLDDPAIAGVAEGRWRGSLGNDMKEDLIRDLAEVVSFRQQVYVVALAARVTAHSGRTTAEQRAVATVVRDGFSGRWQVVAWEWLE